MDIIAAGVAVTTAAMTAALVVLIMFRAGTRRQERAGTLARIAPGPAARLTCRITGLYAETPPARGQARTARCVAQPAVTRNEAQVP